MRDIVTSAYIYPTIINELPPCLVPPERAPCLSPFLALLRIPRLLIFVPRFRGRPSCVLAELGVAAPEAAATREVKASIMSRNNVRKSFSEGNDESGFGKKEI